MMLIRLEAVTPAVDWNLTLIGWPLHIRLPHPLPQGCPSTGAGSSPALPPRHHNARQPRRRDASDDYFHINHLLHRLLRSRNLCYSVLLQAGVQAFRAPGAEPGFPRPRVLRRRGPLAGEARSMGGMGRQTPETCRTVGRPLGTPWLLSFFLSSFKP